MLSLRKPLSDFAARTGIGEIVVSGTSTTFVADGYSFVFFCIFIVSSVQISLFDFFLFSKYYVSSIAIFSKKGDIA